MQYKRRASAASGLAVVGLLLLLVFTQVRGSQYVNYKCNTANAAGCQICPSNPTWADWECGYQPLSPLSPGSCSTHSPGDVCEGQTFNCGPRYDCFGNRLGPPSCSLIQVCYTL